MAANKQEDHTELLTVQEFAKVAKLSTATVYRMVKDGTLDGYVIRYGNSIRIHRDAVVPAPPDEGDAETWTEPDGAA